MSNVKENVFDDPGNIEKNMKIYHRQGVMMIAILAGLLLLVSIFESLRYFAPLVFETKNITNEQALPDGSVVMLNTNSTLRVSSEWKNDVDREAWLKGEAFFHVRKVADTNGFTIHTSRFDVVASESDLNVLDRKDTVQVWLQNGTAYILSHDSKPRRTPVSPGDLVEYTGGQVVTRRYEGTEISAWKNKK